MISGVVRPNTVLPSVRRVSSMPADDIAPLVRAADLQRHAEAAVQLEEIVALQDHVVEFEEGQRLLALQPQLHAVEGQHAVDGEMRADVAQQRNVAERVSQSALFGHDRVGRAVAEAQERIEAAADARHVGGDLLVGEQLADLVLAGRIADARGAAAHQHERPMAVPLQQAQDHDLHQAADMQAVGGAVEADIGGDGAGAQRRVQPLGVGALEDEAALGGFVQEIAVDHGARWASTDADERETLGKCCARSG